MLYGNSFIPVKKSSRCHGLCKKIEFKRNGPGRYYTDRSKKCTRCNLMIKVDPEVFKCPCCNRLLRSRARGRKSRQIVQNKKKRF
jgi:hypothetical protein